MDLKKCPWIYSPCPSTVFVTLYLMSSPVHKFIIRSIFCSSIPISLLYFSLLGWASTKASFVIFYERVRRYACCNYTRTNWTMSFYLFAHYIYSPGEYRRDATLAYRRLTCFSFWRRASKARPHSHRDDTLSNSHRTRIIYANNAHNTATVLTCFLFVRPYVARSPGY